MTEKFTRKDQPAGFAARTRNLSPLRRAWITAILTLAIGCLAACAYLISHSWLVGLIAFTCAVLGIVVAMVVVGGGNGESDPTGGK